MALYQVDPSSGDITAADPAAPLLAADDLAAIRGDGIFEVGLLRGGQIRALEYHLERFECSARQLDLLGASKETWRAALLAAAAAAPPIEGDGYVRWYLSRGREDSGIPLGWILVDQVTEATYRERTNGLAAVSLNRGHPAGIAAEAPWLLLGVKSLSYAAALAATRFAKARGADDAIYTSTDGFVLEAPRSNVIIARDGALLTPDPSLGTLHGTTQRYLFDRAAEVGWSTRYAHLRLSDLFEADGVWLVSALRTAVPVHRLNGTALQMDPELAAAMSGLNA